MKSLRYIFPMLALGAMMAACNDDELPQGDPHMTLLTEIGEAHFGDTYHFTINASDPEVDLSTIHAKLYFDSELVQETVIRTKENGANYEGEIDIPYLANIPDGNATLRLSLQNINFTRTEVDYKLHITHPDFPYLEFVTTETQTVDGVPQDVEHRYRMNRESANVYSFTESGLPQKLLGFIHAPAVGENGKPLVFGYESNTIKVGSESPIPFSNIRAGRYTVTFNTFSFDASPFSELKINGIDLQAIDDNTAAVDLNLNQGATLTVSGFPNFGDWWIDPDYFLANDNGTLTFLPMGGNYRIIADQKLKYFRVYALTGSDPTTLNEDGSGALWVIGDNVGKPSLAANTVGWTTENALCMAQVSDRVYQLTLVAGKTLSRDATNFKFFGQMGWGVELTGADFAEVTSSVIGVGHGDDGHDNGNLYLLPGASLLDNHIYVFTVDLTGGIHAARLTVREAGEQPFEEKKVFVNGNKMTTNDNAFYEISIQLNQGDVLTFDGVPSLAELYVDPDYFTYNADSEDLTFNPIAGLYKISLNMAAQTIGAVRLNSDGTDATLTGDGHGIWLMGWGVGSPSQDSQFGWDPGKAYCMAEVAPNIYQFTGTAGPENGSQIGDRFRADYLSFKFFHQNGWGGEFSGDNALSLTGTASLFIKDAGNFELAGGVQLEKGATYRVTIDITNGVSAGTINMEKL